MGDEVGVGARSVGGRGGGRTAEESHGVLVWGRERGGEWEVGEEGGDGRGGVREG